MSIVNPPVVAVQVYDALNSREVQYKRGEYKDFLAAYTRWGKLRKPAPRRKVKHADLDMRAYYVNGMDAAGEIVCDNGASDGDKYLVRWFKPTAQVLSDVELFHEGQRVKPSAAYRAAHKGELIPNYGEVLGIDRGAGVKVHWYAKGGTPIDKGWESPVMLAPAAEGRGVTETMGDWERYEASQELPETCPTCGEINADEEGRCTDELHFPFCSKKCSDTYVAAQGRNAEDYARDLEEAESCARECRRGTEERSGAAERLINVGNNVADDVVEALSRAGLSAEVAHYGHSGEATIKVWGPRDASYGKIVRILGDEGSGATWTWYSGPGEGYNAAEEYHKATERLEATQRFTVYAKTMTEAREAFRRGHPGWSVHAVDAESRMPDPMGYLEYTVTASGEATEPRATHG